jgi:hypothetical protein
MRYETIPHSANHSADADTAQITIKQWYMGAIGADAQYLK